MDTGRPEPEQSASAGQPTFGALLRQYRLVAGLSQEELAERAGLSAQALSALENGRRQAPYRHTVALLITAMGLAETEAAALAASVIRPRVPTGAAAGETPVDSANPAIVPAPVPDAVRVPDATPATALPTGTLTFLLTDIEGSTSFWEQHPAAMQTALARHDVLIDQVLERHGGRQVKERGEGDSILAVFTSATSALAAACALQAALLAEPWPAQTPLRVRMGLHTGEAELRGIGYYGVTVNRTARIRSLAHGGQVLLSQATADLVRPAPPEGVSLRALGAHTLKGLAQPEEIYQVLHPRLPADFPPIAGAQAHRTNLPLQVTSFIGREREQEEVRALLQGVTRLVTLTGAGGAGKTRLALAVADGMLGEFPDGLWLVELAALADPALVTQTVAGVLGLREEPNRPLLATLADHLTERRLLLVLDNCEHLVTACAALVAALLRSCAHLRILATSRETLAVPGETTYRVPSLAAPDPAHLPGPEQLPAFPAVDLFMQRARSRRPDFTLSAPNIRAVAEICARLDGMPLAIELAAARVGSLPVEAIAARLDDRFRLLTGGQRTALRRQQSLGATLDWSYGLLDPAEQLLLDRLSIFAGGWTLDAAEAVCADGVEPLGGSQGWEIPDHLDALVNKSLALLEDAGAGWDHERYRLLETVREYGAARLRARGEEVSQVRDRHLAWCVALAEAFAPRLTGQEQRRWLARLEAEHDNLRAALTWARERGGSDEGLRLAGALWRFWYLRGYLSEGWAWLSTNLAQAGGAATSAAWATAAHGASVLAWVRADYADAVQYGERALQVWRTRGHTQGMAASLNLLGLVAGDQDLWEHAEAAHTESLALREPEDYWGRATSLHNLGTAVRRRGDRERALALYGESLAIRQAHGDVAGLAIAYRDQAAMALEEGDSERAVSLYRQSLSHAADLGDILGVALCLGGLATVAAGQARAEVAAQLVGAAAALRESVGAPLTPRERGEQAQLLATLRTALGARFDDLSAAGRARHWEELVQTYVAAD